MAAIRSSDTEPEVWLRKQLHAAGLRYRKNSSRVKGRPDAWLARWRTAVFVHGCFWHRHQGCPQTTTPHTNEEYWQKKFERNVQRDRETKAALLEAGLRVVIVWECTVKKMRKDNSLRERTVARIKSFLVSDERFFEL